VFVCAGGAPPWTRPGILRPAKRGPVRVRTSDLEISRLTASAVSFRGAACLGRSELLGLVRGDETAGWSTEGGRGATVSS